jgi:folate-binding protein YgfZ
MKQDSHAAYEAAQQRAAFYRFTDPGYLRISGQDRVDFLQRQSTNDLRLLKPGNTILSVLTSPKARALSLPGRSAATSSFLQSRIFFMDNVSVHQVSERFVQYDLLGPASGELIAVLGAFHLPAVDEIVSLQIGGDEIRIFGSNGLISPGYRVLVPEVLDVDIRRLLRENGAEELPGGSYDLIRVERGIPGPGGELSEAYTPLEVGLDQAVAENKVCYTGQEVITRQITYDKVNRQLSGMRFEGEVLPGGRLLSEGKAVGVITSVAHSPRFGWIGLAVIKRPHHTPGVDLQVEVPGPEDEACTLYSAVVNSLPFH